ncbi:MAG: RagB/SusD family nutrient uptake outer membrane protein [Arcicella sp.]|nr:RagB/SusD family nutrient uptake outer membrane protein [Arcicella sp.]
MKKTLRNIFLLATAFTLTFSCKNLEEQPDFASPSSFYKDEKDMEAAINGVYRPLNQQWSNTFYCRSVFECALGIAGGYEKGPQYYETGAYVASDEYIDAYWKDNYDGINRANVILDRIGSVPKEKLSDAKRTRIMGEAHFLRAFYLYQVYVYFENVPVPDKSTTALGVNISNEGGKAKALALMEADLKAAENELLAKNIDADAGRPNKWAAKTLLSKVYLEAGKWNDAATKAKEVIDQSGLTLFPDFADAFGTTKENSGERLFEVQNDFATSPWANYNNMHAHFTPTDWDGGDPNSLEVGDNVTAAGWGDAWIVSDGTFRSKFEAGDKRIKATFMEQYRSKNAGGEIVKYDPKAKSGFVAPNSSERTFNNVILQKNIEYKIGGWQYTKKNYVLLRLSDALLAHSEAVANGASGDGLFGVNTVRARAGLKALSGVSGQALKDAVFNEWLREFAGEGWAFPTARRFGKTAEVIKEFAGRTVDNAKFRVLPIPLVEINANSSVKQNASW